MSTYRLPIELVPLDGRAPRWQLGVVTRAGHQASEAAGALGEMLWLVVAHRGG